MKKRQIDGGYRVEKRWSQHVRYEIRQLRLVKKEAFFSVSLGCSFNYLNN